MITMLTSDSSDSVLGTVRGARGSTRCGADELLPLLHINSDDDGSLPPPLLSPPFNDTAAGLGSWS